MKITCNVGDVKMVTTTDSIELTTTCLAGNDDSADENADGLGQCELKVEADTKESTVALTALKEQPFTILMQKDQLLKIAALIEEFDL